MKQFGSRLCGDIQVIELNNLDIALRIDIAITVFDFAFATVVVKDGVIGATAVEDHRVFAFACPAPRRRFVKPQSGRQERAECNVASACAGDRFRQQISRTGLRPIVHVLCGRLPRRSDR